MYSTMTEWNRDATEQAELEWMQWVESQSECDVCGHVSQPDTIDFDADTGRILWSCDQCGNQWQARF